MDRPRWKVYGYTRDDAPVAKDKAPRSVSVRAATSEDAAHYVAKIYHMDVTDVVPA